MTDGKQNPDYRQAVEFLYQLQWFGARFGLETPLRLAGLLGNPERTLRFIHVAGTNGKGSTCAMLESIYRAAGYRVGLFTSPHLVSFRERIQVNRQMIPPEDVVRLVQIVRGALKEFSRNDHPTFFEAVTVMALLYFAEQKCDLVIWETGLGGRLDATNIVTPLAGVITNIQFDHQKWLGETLADIATEKAGIMKPGVPIITAAEEPEALEVIQKTAAEKNAPLTVCSAGNFYLAEKIPTSSLPGEHQKKNAALAITTVNVLQKPLPVTEEQIRLGLETVNWPGRLQLHVRPSGQKILLDGAHNAAGAQALARSLRELFPEARPVLILGILQDKDWAAICKILVPLAATVVLVAVQNERTATPDQLAGECRALNPAARIICSSSLANALTETISDPLVVITGSLYLVGEAMELLEPGLESCGERRLNEWSLKP